MVKSSQIHLSHVVNQVHIHTHRHTDTQLLWKLATCIKECAVFKENGSKAIKWKKEEIGSPMAFCLEILDCMEGTISFCHFEYWPMNVCAANRDIATHFQSILS